MKTNLDKVFHHIKNIDDEELDRLVRKISDPKIIYRWLNRMNEFNIPLDEKMWENGDDVEIANLFADEPLLFLYAVKKAVSDIVDDVKFMRYRFIQDIRNKPLFYKKFSKIKSISNVNQLMSSRGIILSVSDIHNVVVLYCYEDETGKKIFSTSSKVPKGCVYDDDCSVKMDMVKVLVQEEGDSGKMKPDTMTLTYYFDSELHDNVLSHLQPGNLIYFYAVPIRTKNYKSGRVEFRREFVMADYRPIEESFEEVKLTKDDISKILEISKDDKLVDNLVKSFAPELKHVDKMKEAVLISLFGGIGDKRLKRDLGNIHVLLIGEPGVGKTKLMMDAMRLLPKSSFVDGVHVTKAGMVASLVKDEDTYMLEAGALLLANDGFLFIDEFDKMDKEAKYSLLEAMQSGEVFFNKVIKSKFKVDTTVIASMNPKFSNVNEIPIQEQVDFNDPIITRFGIKLFVRKMDSEEAYRDITHTNLIDEEEVLKEAVYDEDTLRKYIAYARSNVKPVLSKEAMRRLEEVTVSLLKGDKRLNIRLVTQLKQIAIAYAKMRLSDTVTVEDVKRAVDMVTYAMSTLGLSADIYFGSLYEKEKVSNIRYEILKVVPSTQPIPKAEIIKKLKVHFSIERIEKAIDYMLRSGELSEPRFDMILRIVENPFIDFTEEGGKL